MLTGCLVSVSLYSGAYYTLFDSIMSPSKSVVFFLVSIVHIIFLSLNFSSGDLGIMTNTDCYIVASFTGS